MRKFIVDCWNSVMDHEKNPLSNIPDLNVRHMIMQVLAFIWSGVFAVSIADSVMVFSISALAHVLIIGAVAITVGTFKIAEHKPWLFGSYHSHGRQRLYTVYYDANGNPYKVPLDPHDPGGEHE